MTTMRVTAVMGDECFVGRARVTPGSGRVVTLLWARGRTQTVVTDDLPAGDGYPPFLAMFGRNEKMQLVPIGAGCTREGLAWYRTLTRDDLPVLTFRRIGVNTYEEVTR